MTPSLQLSTPPTYPARPINGGPLPKAPLKSGNWFYEPKYNGWRALVHVPTGTMFNRKGEKLSIAGEFSAALRKLRTFLPDGHPIEWLDCEALERRHQMGRGSLFVLDFIPPKDEAMFHDPDASPMFFGLHPESDYDRRRQILTSIFGDSFTWADDKCLARVPATDQIYLTPSIKACNALPLWNELTQANAILREWQKAKGVAKPQDFYEGVVAKRADARYPVQLRRPDEETHTWMKHRWAW